MNNEINGCVHDFDAATRTLLPISKKIYYLFPIQKLEVSFSISKNKI
jgi:hypothetical protein